MDREQIEQETRARHEAKDHAGAATVALRGYGPEIYGFLVALHRSEQDAADVFSQFSEDLWRGLPGFGWASSLRTWAYTLARNASHRFRRGQRRKPGGVALDEQGSMASKLAAEVRTGTASFLQTEKKTRMQLLRESLPEEDQMLLILRVDRNLAFQDIARIMLEEEGAPSDEALAKEAARLRKRFQLVKEKLLEMGRREGLIPPKE